MIAIYQGVDIVALGKFARVIARNPVFVEEVFTKKEREYCLAHRSHLVHLAGRFAAKEACLKALGLGLGPEGSGHMLQEIEIVNRSWGKPELALMGWVARIAGRRSITGKTVSISHSGDYAVATVVMIGAPQNDAAGAAFN